MQKIVLVWVAEPPFAYSTSEEYNFLGYATSVTAAQECIYETAKNRGDVFDESLHGYDYDSVESITSNRVYGYEVLTPVEGRMNL